MPDTMRINRRAVRHERLRRRVKHHWRRVLYGQAAAYAVVLVLWALPLPNPVKLLAVTFHELSHALAGLLTGGRVFGFAIAPRGSGVTLGLGGNMFLILIAGYIGSCLWGVFLYYLTTKWKPIACLLALELVVIGSSLFGWLNAYTMFFGTGALIIMTGLLFAPDTAKIFFVRMVGSACCLYAPFDIIGEVFKRSGAPNVMGVETQSDVTQLAALTGVHPVPIALAILIVQAGILIWLIRLTCSGGAKQAVTREIADGKARRRLWRDIHPEQKRYVIRCR